MEELARPAIQIVPLGRGCARRKKKSSIRKRERERACIRVVSFSLPSLPFPSSPFCFLSAAAAADEEYVCCQIKSMKMRGRLRLRPAETMKANTGNGKLPSQKDEKAVIAELQRTTRGKVPWISSLGKHQGG